MSVGYRVVERRAAIFAVLASTVGMGAGMPAPTPFVGCPPVTGAGGSGTGCASTGVWAAGVFCAFAGKRGIVRAVSVNRAEKASVRFFMGVLCSIDIRVVNPTPFDEMF